MVTFKSEIVIGNEIEVDERGLVVRGSNREDVLYVVETGKRILRISPGYFRVTLPLSHDEKRALASALKQAARKQRHS